MKRNSIVLTKTTKRFRMLGAAAVALGCLSQPLVADKKSGDDELLTIGSKAPSIDVEHWVQNGNGKFKKITDFDSGKVYVVEFWATWCGPCVASMPHLSELQKKYQDRGVQIVSISDEDLETVETFLEREVKDDSEVTDSEADTKDDGKKKRTFADVTSAYCLTTDPDRSVSKDYMEAAQQNGIPTAFIVGKNGLIEWIGHPMEMDGPLESVVGDKWDRDAYLAEFKASQEAQENMNKIFKLMGRGKSEQAIELIDSLIKETKAEQVQQQYKLLKLQLLIQGSESDKAVGFTEEFLGELAQSKNGLPMVNQIAWTLVELTEAGQIDNKELLKAAIPATEKASKDSEASSRSAVLDTLAHLLYLTGDLDKAITVQEQAIAGAGEEIRDGLKEFLEKLTDEKKSKK